jgi:hypothetical protein
VIYCINENQRLILAFDQSQLIIGSTTSIILFLLMIGIVAHDVLPQSFGARPDSGGGNGEVRSGAGGTFGILEAVWLTTKRQDLQGVMEHIDTPNSKNLRHAGMEKVTLRPRLVKRASWS